MSGIIFVHILNDRSGSPKVLRDVINGQEENSDNVLVLARGGEGWLSCLNIKKRYFSYRRSPFKIYTLLYFLAAQVLLAYQVARQMNGRRLVYVNTLLPFSAALVAKLAGRKVIYHVHEVSLSPRLLHNFLLWVACKTADSIICVSQAQAKILNLIDDKRTVIVHNCIDAAFYAKAQMAPKRRLKRGIFTVLMLASLREYKGIWEFARIAEILACDSDIVFHLVLNDEDALVDGYSAQVKSIRNLVVHYRTSTPEIYYETADLVLNLSRPDLWIETFGLTLVEAMAYGIPVIAPPVGGVVEIISHGVHGYLEDSRNVDEIAELVLKIKNNPGLYAALSKASLERAADFQEFDFSSKIRDVISSALLK